MDTNGDLRIDKGLYCIMTEKKQLLDIITAVIDDSLANLHTAAIARVTKVNETTINCQPVIARVVNGEKIELPEFQEVPPMFLQGGTSYTAHPIAVGDYALLIFTERCFDSWYAGVDGDIPLEYRMHDYSDGFAIVGLNPLSGAITIPERITQIGDTYQEGNYEHVGNKTQEGNATQTGDRTQTGNHIINGNLTINGNITVNGQGGGAVSMNDVNFVLTNGDITADGVSLKTHTHGGVTTGGGNTGQPN